jgi:transcriptional regulator with XRE-family HTH domain
VERDQWRKGQQRYQNRSIPLPTLRTLRTRRGLTQRQLARTAGISPTTVLNLERGRRGAYAATVQKLAVALELTPEQLLREHHPE